MTNAPGLSEERVEIIDRIEARLAILHDKGSTMLELDRDLILRMLVRRLDSVESKLQAEFDEPRTICVGEGR